MNRTPLLPAVLFVSLFCLASSLSAQTAGVFEVRFNDSALSTQQRNELAPTLDATKSFWESIITGYQPNINLDGIDIVVEAADIDGSGGVLAQAGPGGLSVNRGGFRFLVDNQLNSSRGVITIDTADFSTPLILDVVKHEVGHTLGFGTLFNLNSLSPDPGEYIGSAGLATYRIEYDSSANFVPLQNQTFPNGAVAFNGHLDENNPMSDAFGRRLRDDLMTPIISNTTNANNPFRNFLSDTSLAILRDLGYATIDTTFVAPEPVLGDANLDGSVTFLDIAPFIQLLSSGDFLEQADCNIDGAVDFLDIAPFIGFLTGG
jgi:hypothetical protein